jgi:electron transport complex protein RnfG
MTGRSTLPPAAWSGDIWPLCDDTALLRGRAEGYAGAIDWLLFIDLAPIQRIRALRVIAHRETPGIADFLNQPEHPWMQAFVTRTAGEPPPDTLTGATVTTRALGENLVAALAAATPPAAGACP